MPPEDFIRIASVSELAENRGLARRLEEDEIGLVKSEGRVTAFINVCPHQHTPLVDKYGGQISGGVLTCSMHGWSYDLESGNCVNESGRLKLLEVKIENEWILVKRPARSSNW